MAVDQEDRTFMEQQPLYPFLLQPLLFLLPVLLFLFCVSKAGSAAKRHRHRPGLRLPPGPWTLPVIGSVHHLVGSLPHHALRDLARRHGPLMMLKIGEVPTVVVSSPEAARGVFKTHDLVFADRPVSPSFENVYLCGLGVVFSPYGDYWRQLRRICMMELLSSKRVKSFKHVRAEETASLLQSVAAATSSSSVVNLREKLQVVVSDITARVVLGKRCAERDAYLRELNVALVLLTGFNLIDLFPSSRSVIGLISSSGRKVRRSCTVMLDILDAIVRAHEEEWDESCEDKDLVDVLLRIRKNGDLRIPLDRDNIKTLIFDLYSAGSETAATTLVWAMAELAKNPSIMQKAQSEIRGAFAGRGHVEEEALGKLSYLQNVIAETLRRHMPGPLQLPRQCREDCQILGYDVPKGTSVIINAWAIANDPRIWENPDEFRPERFEGGDAEDMIKGGSLQFFPFGGGRRLCPGMLFGLANLELVLASLLLHFDWELQVPGRTLDMSEAFGVTAKMKTDLLLRPVLRLPPPQL